MEESGSLNALLYSLLMILCLFAAYVIKKHHFIYLPESGLFPQFYHNCTVRCNWYNRFSFNIRALH
ncbi:uncharacterized protein [Physcomitrium patens]|uniref:uncharacterized protein n=1 Tax=Physcomitrium patens TaxID=3218 RepID=UPI003CCDC875